MLENEVCKVKVIFDGEEVELVSEESREYILDLINYIKEQNIKIQRMTKNSYLTPISLRLLLSINIADDYFKEKIKNNDIEIRFNENIKVIEALKKENLELREINKKNKINLQKYNETLENIKQEKSEQTEQITKLQLQLKDIENTNFELNETKNFLEDKVAKILYDNETDNEDNKKLLKRIKELEEQLLQSQSELNEFILNFDKI